MKNITRRDFLKWCGAVGATAIIDTVGTLERARGEESQVDPTLESFVRRVKESPDRRIGEGKTVSGYEKNFKDGTFARYTDRDANWGEPDGKIGKGDGLMLRTPEGDTYAEEDINGFNRDYRSPNEAAVNLVGDDIKDYSWKNPDEMVRLDGKLKERISRIK